VGNLERKRHLEGVDLDGDDIKMDHEGIGRRGKEWVCLSCNRNWWRVLATTIMICRFHAMRAVSWIATAQNCGRSYKYGSSAAKCQSVEKNGAKVAVRYVTWPWILLPGLRQAHSIFQRQLCTQSDLVLSLSIPIIISCTYVHPVAAHLFFPSLLSFPLSPLQ
jgi:hypothetical protein